jgi:hypothetical protein
MTDNQRAINSLKDILVQVQRISLSLRTSTPTRVVLAERLDVVEEDICALIRGLRGDVIPCEPSRFDDGTPDDTA